ncbi:MAG: preprotein translocase subunit YajC [Oscillospiraceae bacterium]|nr:preprotein translocase subunit YajC [Oscillospiraceae bacterium]
MNPHIINTFAGAADGAQGITTAQSAISMILWMGIFVAMAYFLILRPQKKKEKEQKQLRDNLQIGDEVTTIGGITGIVVRKGEDTVVIETGGDRNKVRVKIWAISENATQHDAAEEGVKTKKSGLGILKGDKEISVSEEKK